MIKQPAWLLAAALASLPVTAKADSVCGPGRRMVDNQWACGPDNGARRSSGPSGYSGNNAAAGVAAGLIVGGAVLSIIQSLASQTQTTDNLGQVELDQQRHGTLSRDHNRRGLALQQAGNFNSARLAFIKARQEAMQAGNMREVDINEKNAHIADALHWLRVGFNAEKGGQITKANVSYRMGIDAAERAGEESLVQKLKNSNNILVSGNKSQKLIKSEGKNCYILNGEYACY